ncbi:MAG TPA: integrase arm-type DNA-binding domain-containing protein, partial [Steroidobacteraceae bacterium]|nr:integrase arm-type DNA-binding domain-containing protein [Steroidobacteraceae bacterium]
MASAHKLLTDVACKTATTKGKEIRKLHDGNGLYLWVYRDGRKYWRLRYIFAGTEKSLSLGVYPQIGLKQARTRCIDERRRLESNQDPAAERRADKLRRSVAAANSFEVVAREWYEKQLHTWVPSHADDVKRRLEKNTFPSIGNRPIDEIEAPELLAALRPIEKRGAHDLAHRMLQVCGQVFRYGIATGRCKRDVARDLRGALTPHQKQHQAAVRPEELPDLLRAISNYDKFG